MAYEYTNTYTDVFVGTSDETFADKIKALNIAINKVINPTSTTPPPDTFTTNMDGSIPTTLTAVPINDNFRLGIVPDSAAKTIKDNQGCDAMFRLYYMQADGSFGTDTTVSLTHTNYPFPILYNSSNTGVRIYIHTFQDKITSSNAITVYKICPISTGEVNENVYILLSLMPTKEYFGDATSFTLYAKASHSSSPYFYLLYNGKIYRHDIVFTGGSSYPPGDYVIASGVNLLSGLGGSSTSMYRHVIDESVLYGLWINGARSTLGIGTSMLVGGSRFISIGNGYCIRVK